VGIIKAKAAGLARQQKAVSQVKAQKAANLGAAKLGQAKKASMPARVKKGFR
jgi:hypothetical protein